MKKLSVFILSLYVVLFCLIGCSGNDDGILSSGFGYGTDVSPAYNSAVAGVANQKNDYSRENIKIKLYYGWSQEHEKNYLFTDEYKDNSVIKLVAMSNEDYKLFYMDAVNKQNGYSEDVSTWENVFEIKNYQPKEFFTDKYRITLKPGFMATVLSFNYSEDISIPPQIFDVNYRIFVDHKERNVRYNSIELALLIICNDKETNELQTHILGKLNVTTNEYEDGKLFVKSISSKY